MKAKSRSKYLAEGCTLIFGFFIIETGVARTDRFQFIEEVHDDLIQGEFELNENCILIDVLHRLLHAAT